MLRVSTRCRLRDAAPYYQQPRHNLRMVTPRAESSPSNCATPRDDFGWAIEDLKGRGSRRVIVQVEADETHGCGIGLDEFRQRVANVAEKKLGDFELSANLVHGHHVVSFFPRIGKVAIVRRKGQTRAQIEAIDFDGHAVSLAKLYRILLHKPKASARADPELEDRDARMIEP